MNVENEIFHKYGQPEFKCQKCGRKIQEGEGNICRRCLIKMSNGLLKKEDFLGTPEANRPHLTRKGRPIGKKEVIG